VKNLLCRIAFIYITATELLIVPLHCLLMQLASFLLAETMDTDMDPKAMAPRITFRPITNWPKFLTFHEIRIRPIELLGILAIIYTICAESLAVPTFLFVGILSIIGLCLVTRLPIYFAIWLEEKILQTP